MGGLQQWSGVPEWVAYYFCKCIYIFLLIEQVLCVTYVTMHVYCWNRGGWQHCMCHSSVFCGVSCVMFCVMWCGVICDVWFGVERNVMFGV